MVILILMVMLFQISSKIAIGNRVVYDDKFVTLNGKFTVTVNEGDTFMYAQQNINYPTGFNKNNCVVLACGVHNTNYSNKGLCFGTLSSEMFSASVVKDAYGKSVQLLDDNINLSVYMNYNASHAYQSYPMEYKITLMKIEPDVSGYTQGDVNMDGQVTMEDATLLQDYIGGRAVLTDKQIKLGDMDNNGVITLTDVYDIIAIVNGQSQS